MNEFHSRDLVALPEEKEKSNRREQSLTDLLQIPRPAFSSSFSEMTMNSTRGVSQSSSGSPWEIERERDEGREGNYFLSVGEAESVCEVCVGVLWEICRYWICGRALAHGFSVKPVRTNELFEFLRSRVCFTKMVIKIKFNYLYIPN